jgi:hypothetical protein
MSYNPYQAPQYPPAGQPYPPTVPPAPASDDESGGKWWQFMLYGIAMFAFAVWLFSYLSDKEREGGRFRMQWMFALIYDFLGKWGVTGVLAGLGTICVLIGTWQLIHRVRARA